MQVTFNLPEELDLALSTLLAIKGGAPRAEEAPAPKEEKSKAKPKAEAPKAEPAEAPAPEPTPAPKKEAEGVTLETIRGKAAKLIQSGNKPKVMDALKELGASSITALEPSMYDQFNSLLDG